MGIRCDRAATGTERAIKALVSWPVLQFVCEEAAEVENCFFAELEVLNLEAGAEFLFRLGPAASVFNAGTDVGFVLEGGLQGLHMPHIRACITGEAAKLQGLGHWKCDGVCIREKACKGLVFA